MVQYYAHSGDIRNNVNVPQLYVDHVKFCVEYSTEFITDCFKKSKGIPEKNKQFMVDAVKIAAFWHDVGKLDSSIQKHLSQTHYAEEKILNHVEAGVLICTRYFNDTKNTAYLMAAYLIYCHHIGLIEWGKFVSHKYNGGFLGKQIFTVNSSIRDTHKISETYTTLSSDLTVTEYVNSKLDEYINIQHFQMGYLPTPKNFNEAISVSAMDIRIMFSCLVDADHTDTELFYGGDKIDWSKLNAGERLNKLKEYVTSLPKNCSTKQTIKRNISREKLFNLALNHPHQNGFINIDAPVGTGKTVACLAQALGVAQTNNCDRIHTILPFTNIISQTVETYRKAVLFKDESELNINEIHSKIEFENDRMRKYSKQWKSPINVSTAVQFFESLVAHNTSAIRKIHWYCNSCYIFDEYDKSMPHQYWKYILTLLIELNEKYNAHFITSSGTPVQYSSLFNIENFQSSELCSVDNWKFYQNEEFKRVKIRLNKLPFNDVNKFEKFVFSRIKIGKAPSALIVVNTIINAQLLYEMLKDNVYGFTVYQLSSAFTPTDKERILKTVKNRLENHDRIILVATSIIECGVDLSFAMGFRQTAGLLSVLQFNGRINRNNEYKNAKTYVFDFGELLADNRNGLFTENPQLTKSVKIFNALKLHELSPEYCTSVVRAELNSCKNPINFNVMENRKDFYSISESFNIINSATINIIVDSCIGDKLIAGEYVKSTEISRNSIQLWITKYDKIVDKIGGIEEITSLYGDKYLIWRLPYDPEFTGIGKTLVELREKY